MMSSNHPDIFPKALKLGHEGMRALGFFRNVLILVIIFRIFAPGLAEHLVTLFTNVVVVLNDAVTALAEGTDQTLYLDTFERIR